MTESARDTDIQHYATRLADDGAKTLSYFQELTPADWGQQVYTTGSDWRVRDILAHFLSAEQAFQALLEDIVQGGSGAPRGMDVVAFNESDVPRFSDWTPQRLMDEFARARRGTVRLAESLKEADLAKQGYHPFFGDSRVDSMVKLIYRHNMIHLRDIRRALTRGAPVAHVEVIPPSQETNP